MVPPQQQQEQRFPLPDLSAAPQVKSRANNWTNQLLRYTTRPVSKQQQGEGEGGGHWVPVRGRYKSGRRGGESKKRSNSSYLRVEKGRISLGSSFLAYFSLLRCSSFFVQLGKRSESNRYSTGRQNFKCFFYFAE